MLLNSLNKVFPVSGQVIIDLPSEVKIEEGTNGTLSCSAISWHPAAHIEWKMLQAGSWVRIANHGAVSQDFKSKFSVTLSSGNDSELTSSLDISGWLKYIIVNFFVNIGSTKKRNNIVHVNGSMTDGIHFSK